METSNSSTEVLTIEQEASKKLVDLLHSRNKKFNKSHAYSLLTGKIDFSDNRKIHTYVKNSIQLMKAIDPVSKFNAWKLQALGDKPILPKESEIISAINKLEFSDSVSKDTFTNYVLQSINN